MAVDVSDFVERLRKALAQITSEPQKPPRQSYRVNRQPANVDAGLLETLRKQNEELRQQLAARDRDLQKISALFRQALQTHRDLGQTLETLMSRIETRHQDYAIPARAKNAREPEETPGAGGPINNSELPKAERKILSVLARHNPEPRPKRAIAVEAGYAVSGGGFNNALSRLRTLGMIQGIDPLRLTHAGSNYVAQYKQESLPTGAALAVYWMERLPKAERTILEVLTRPPRRYLTKEAIAIDADYRVTGGGFLNALSRLRTLLLVEGRAEIAASERLFD